MRATRVNRLHFVNVYLVPEEDGLTLIDTAVPRSSKQILAAAEAQGAPIRRIVLTHAHGDHVGSLDELAAQLGDVEVVISEREERLLRKDMSLDPGEPRDKLRGGYPGRETRPTRTVGAGDAIGSLEVIRSPGHTPGHISLLDRRDGTLFSGDAWSTLGGTAVPSKMNPRFPLVWMATWHRPTALESAKALRRLEPQRLAPGHGQVIEEPLEAMDAAIARAE